MIRQEQLSNLHKGQIVEVDDPDLMIQLHELAKDAKPHFLIDSVQIFSDGDYKQTHFVLDHIGSDFEWLLVTESFEDALDVKIFGKPDFFKPNVRSILQKNEETAWMFDRNDYPQEIHADEDIFKRKVQCEVFNNTALIEYETGSKIIDYLILIKEEGIFNDKGGWVSFYEGRQIRTTDLKIQN